MPLYDIFQLVREGDITKTMDGLLFADDLEKELPTKFQDYQLYDDSLYNDVIEDMYLFFWTVYELFNKCTNKISLFQCVLDRKTNYSRYPGPY